MAESVRPVWVAWTLHEVGAATLRSDERIGNAFATLAGIPIAAVLANCTSTEAVTAAMPKLIATEVPTLRDWLLAAGHRIVPPRP